MARCDAACCAAVGDLGHRSSSGKAAYRGERQRHLRRRCARGGGGVRPSQQALREGSCMCTFTGVYEPNHQLTAVCEFLQDHKVKKSILVRNYCIDSAGPYIVESNWKEQNKLVIQTYSCISVSSCAKPSALRLCF